MKRLVPALLVLGLLPVLSTRAHQAEGRGQSSRTSGTKRALAIGDAFALSERVSAKVTGHTALDAAPFLDKHEGTEDVRPAEGRRFHIVTVEFTAKGEGPGASSLKLGDALLHLRGAGGAPSAAKSLSFQGSFLKPHNLRFYRSICSADQSPGSLDFGVGYSGMDLTMKHTLPYGASPASPDLPCIATYHGPPNAALTFLFEVPSEAVLAAFQLGSKKVMLKPPASEKAPINP